jgi:hypothetical protein
VIETLRARFGSEVQLDTLQVSVVHGLVVTGSGLRIFPQNSQGIGGGGNPLIAIKQFQFRASPAGLFFKPTHVRQVNVSGFAINVPPSAQRSNAIRHEHGDKVKIKVDKIICDDSQLVMFCAISARLLRGPSTQFSPTPPREEKSMPRELSAHGMRKLPAIPKSTANTFSNMPT